MPDAGAATSQGVIEDKGWCLDEAAVHALAGLGAALRSALRPGQDIEWAVSGGNCGCCRRSRGLARPEASPLLLTDGRWLGAAAAVRSR
jgi:hypothetical protein